MFSLITYILITAIGFMMGFLYKKTHTQSSFFNPDPKKSLKIFSWFLGGAIVVLLALSALATHSLKATPIPEEANMDYNNYHSVIVFVLNLSFLILVVLSNAYSQSLKKLAFVPYILAAAFYIMFILGDAYFVSDIYLMWQKSMQLINGELPDYTENALTKSFLGFSVTAFNAVMIWWSLRK